jgi:small-conductance mechanosensitive channel
MARYKIYFRFSGLLFFLLFVIASQRGKADPARLPDTLIKPQVVVNVAPFGKTIFTISAGIGPFTVTERAKAMEGRIRDLASNPFFRVDSMRVFRRDNTVNILYGDIILGTVSVRDSVAEHTSLEKIALHRMYAVNDAIGKYREENSKTSIFRSILFSALVLILFALLIFIVNRLYHLFKNRILSYRQSERKILAAFGYEFLNKERQVAIFLFLNKLSRALLFLLLLVIGLLAMFYFLPWTKSFTLAVLDQVLSPVRHVLSLIWRFVPNFIIILVILTITFYINRFFRFLKNEIEREVLNLPGFFPEWALPTYNIIRVIVWVFTIIVIWPYIPGSDSKIFQGISVFLGLVFSLTSASLLSNIMSGFTLTYTRAFHLGDVVKIGDVMGKVSEKSMLVTKVMTIKNEEVTIPNSKIMSSEVINFSAQAAGKGLILHTSVTIGYDAPWKKIHELLISAAVSTEGILTDPPPFVLQKSLDDFYINYEINAYTRDPLRIAQLYSELHQNIQDKFNEAGMEIMSPHYKSIRDGNTIAIPEEYRGEKYDPPSFRVNSM